MGSDESHFKISVGSDRQSHKTVSTNHNLFEEKGESNRGPSAYQPNALLLGQTGSLFYCLARAPFMLQTTIPQSCCCRRRPRRRCCCYCLVGFVVVVAVRFFSLLAGACCSASDSSADGCYLVFSFHRRSDPRSRSRCQRYSIPGYSINPRPNAI